MRMTNHDRALRYLVCRNLYDSLELADGAGYGYGLGTWWFGAHAMSNSGLSGCYCYKIAYTLI